MYWCKVHFHLSLDHFRRWSFFCFSYALPEVIIQRQAYSVKSFNLVPSLLPIWVKSNDNFEHISYTILMDTIPSCPHKRCRKLTTGASNKSCILELYRIFQETKLVQRPPTMEKTHRKCIHQYACVTHKDN
jgi:hypothetical protein